MKHDFSLWRDRRIFLSGHTGFKGGWLALALNNLGAHVHGYALPPATTPNLFDLACVGEFVQGADQDINNAVQLKSALTKAAPDIIFHLAAQPLVRLSYADPVTTWATNVMGTIHLLEAVRSTPSVRAVIVVTSDKCYADTDRAGGCLEHDPLGGKDPYSSSKGATEIAVHSWRESFFASPCSPLISTVRAGNVIGGGDWSPDRLITDAVAALMAGRPVALRYPNATRPWQHVIDAISGYLLLGERLLSGESAVATSFNFGPLASDVRPVKDVIGLVAQHFGISDAWVQAPGTHPPESPALTLDSSKARRMLGWEPCLDLDGAVQLTALWFKAWATGGDMRAITRQQINNWMMVRKI
jgi:CDP-glucose 4,6-dehydratase